MTRCPGCGLENRDGVRFCEECGAQLERICPACGSAIPPGRKFCGSCGQGLAPSPTPAVQRFGSPESYTPKHLAEKILTSKAALEGERKQVTVLFADLKGSMELLADRDPEEARKILDPVLERMMEAVHRYEGTVNQVMGDGIMALFGAPVAHEDHAVRACYAAFDMQVAIRRYAEEMRRNHGVVIQVRVGLNSGEVLVRTIGSDLRMDYTAVGQTTHVAARMEQLAKPDTTLLTADVLRLAEGYIAVTPLGPVPVKGLEAPLEVYEMVGVGARRSRLHAAVARGLTRFVGREGELDQLRQMLTQAATGHGQVVALVGEPGVGKSRVVWEVTHSHRTHGWLILQVGSVSYGKATPYLPVIDLLRGYCQIEDRDDARRVREKVTGKLLTLERALEPTLPAVLMLLDVPVEEDAAWQALDPPQRRQQTLDAVKRLLVRESRVQPLLLVFEDLHWIDSETQAILDCLVEALPTARLLLLVNYRPEYAHRWGSKTYYSQLRLDPLPLESAEELLGALLGDDATLPSLKRLLIERTEGNPFFLEESVRTLVETNVLTGERGAYRLVRTPATIEVPATVQAMLGARIDRLPPEEKRLLQAASVVGVAVPVALLQAIAEQPAEALYSGLAHLQAAEFLYETTLFPDSEYTFKHALTQEVAYGSLLQERRRTLHARIVDAVETLYPDRLPEQVDRLAYHAFRGETWEKAVAYLSQAGAKALARSAYREATTSFEQALAALVYLPLTRETQKQAIDLRLGARAGLVGLGENEKSLDHLRDAEALAEMLGDRRRLAWISVHTTLQFWFMGQPADMVAAGQRAVAIAGETDDLPLHAMAGTYLGLGYHAIGDYRQAIECLARSRDFLEGDQIYERGVVFNVLTAAYSRAWLGWCLAEVGRFADAMEQAREALRIAEAANNPSSLVLGSRSVGLIHLRLGEIARAIPPLERAVEVGQSADLRTLFDITASFLGYAYALDGRLAEALPLLEQALADPAATGRTQHPLLMAHLAETHLMACDPDRALAVAQQGLDLAHRQKERGNEAWVLRLLGQIAAHGDSPDTEAARRHYGAALARAEELGMRPLQAHCHLGLGTLYRKIGERPKAEEHLTTATTMCREMNMGFWLAQVETALREPGPRGGR